MTEGQKTIEQLCVDHGIDAKELAARSNVRRATACRRSCSGGGRQARKTGTGSPPCSASRATRSRGATKHPCSTSTAQGPA